MPKPKPHLSAPVRCMMMLNNMDNEKLLPPGMPSPAQQQWGVVISILIIVLMIIVGAFYAWGQRIAQDQIPATTAQ